HRVGAEPADRVARRQREGFAAGTTEDLDGVVQAIEIADRYGASVVADRVRQTVEPGAGVPVSAGEEPVRPGVELESRADLMDPRVEEVEEGVVAVEHEARAELGGHAGSVRLAWQDL